MDVENSRFVQWADRNPLWHGAIFGFLVNTTLAVIFAVGAECLMR